MAQHNLPRRPTVGRRDAGDQLRLPCPAAAAVMAHPVEDVAERPVVPTLVRLVDHLHLATAVAFDAQEPRRERVERLQQGLGSGRQRIVA